MRCLYAIFITALASPVLAGGIIIEDAYARASRPGAPTGAIFMIIRNESETDDHLVGVESTVAKRVELHTHIEDNGVMKMRHVESGFPLPAGSTHELARGGDHVMLMGVTEELETGAEIPLSLIFEKAGEIAVKITVDNERGQSGHMPAKDN